MAKWPEILVSQIPIQGIPLVKHSFVGQGLDDTLDINVALGQEILVSNQGCHSNSNFLNCPLCAVLTILLVF